MLDVQRKKEADKEAGDEDDNKDNLKDHCLLGVRRDSSDEEIRRYYKRQAVLVHPDKNRQRGAEEAFKILAHAFELIGSPEQRNHYDQLLQEAVEMESAWAELNELISRLHSKMDEAANTIRCTNCAKRHRRLKTERPCYAARYCQVFPSILKRFRNNLKRFAIIS